MGAQATQSMVTLFIFVHEKVLTVAQDITPSEDGVLYTGVTVCILQCQTDFTASGSLQLATEALLNTKMRQ